MSDNSDEPITRRNLLGRALGATVLGAALLNAEDQLKAQTPHPAPRVRESMDFGWKFFKGDVPGAQAPGFADAQWRAVDLPHDWSIEGPFGENERTRRTGWLSVDGHRMVSKTLPSARRIQQPKSDGGIRRCLSEQ